MKKFTSLLIGCSLALAGAAIAQQPEEQSSPKPNEAVQKGKGHSTDAKPAAPKEVKPVAPKEVKPTAAPEQHGGKPGPDGTKMEQTQPMPKHQPSVPAQTKGSAEKAAGDTTAGAKPDVKAEELKKETKTPPMTAKPEATPLGIATPPPIAKPATTPVTIATPPPVAKTSATPVAVASPAPSVAVAGDRNARPPGAMRKPDPQKVQQIKTQHANFKAQPRPEKVPTVTFTENRRIEGSDRWQGQQYETFRSYRAERHDRDWYHSRYRRVELIGGGYYYWNNNYWYPAWGYDNSQQYYAYDGPIYVGRRAEPLDRVIADVQAVLQEMGYYKGEVDGLLGPLTRQALTSYQAEQGLVTTAAIDEPTLDALGMGS